MGFNFPNAPADGALFTPAVGGPTYTWDNTAKAWKLTSGGLSSGVYIGDVPPSNPVQGQLWWNSTTGLTYIYYNDGNTSQWVNFNTGPVPAEPYPLTVADMRLSSKQTGVVALNSKKDGSGTDVMTVDNLGRVALTGSSGGIAYNRLGGNTFGFKWNNALYYDVDLGGATSRLWADANTTWSQLGNGYVKFPNGLIIQWGQTNNSVADWGFAWPTAFPNALINVLTQIVINPGTAVFVAHCDSVSLSAVNWRLRRADPGGGITGLVNCPFYWLAIGW